MKDKHLFTSLLFYYSYFTHPSRSLRRTHLSSFLCIFLILLELLLRLPCVEELCVKVEQSVEHKEEPNAEPCEVGVLLLAEVVHLVLVVAVAVDGAHCVVEEEGVEHKHQHAHVLHIRDGPHLTQSLNKKPTHRVRRHRDDQDRHSSHLKHPGEVYEVRGSGVWCVNIKKVWSKTVLKKGGANGGEKGDIQKDVHHSPSKVLHCVVFC